MSDPAHPERRSDWRTVAQFIAIAILIHIAAWPLLRALVPEPEPFDPSLVKQRRVRVVSAAPTKRPAVNLPKMQRPEEEKSEQEDKTEEKEPEKNNELDGQVVDIPPMADDTPPEDSRLLSENNTRVERETISRHRQPPQNAVTREPTKTAEAGLDAERDPEAIDIGAPEKKREKKEAKQANKNTLELPERSAKDLLALKLDSSGRFRNQDDREPLSGSGERLRLSLNGDDVDKDQQAQDGAEARAPKRAEKNNLVPSIGFLARIAGAPMNDHVEGIDEGEGTFLNTREFKYASFFNRMKRGIAQHWHPQAEYRRRDPSGNIYGARARTTVLEVTLDAEGTLQDISVTRSSGLDFLDAVAVSAMRSAQPFPNPPRGMLNDDSQIVFDFGFTLDFRGRGIRLPF